MILQLNFFDWFSQWFSETLTPIVDFFKNFVHSLNTLLKLLPTIISTISNTFAYVPSVFNAFLVISVFVLILYVILGRKAGDS